MEEIEAFVEEIPEEKDHPSKELALADMTSWCNYEEYRLVKVTLPIAIPKPEPVEKPEPAINPLENMVEI